MIRYSKPVFIILLFVVSACASGITRVPRLDLRDSRLPIDARRWLADTEDEVVIARSRMDDIYDRLDRIKTYQKSLKSESVFTSAKGAKAGAGKTEELFNNYAMAQVNLTEMQFKTAQKVFELARARLNQARAETAIRYDLAVYEMEPIVLEVDNMKKEVAAAQIQLQSKQADVEKSADNLWRGYAKFVKEGGSTNIFWKFRSINFW